HHRGIVGIFHRIRPGGRGGERSNGKGAETGRYLARKLHITPFYQSATSSVSPVRIRTACATSRTKILPSPMAPVLADCWIASTTRPARSSVVATSTLIFGTMLVLYSAPR